MGEPITQEYLSKYLGWKMRVDSNLERIARAKSAELFPGMRESDGSKRNPGASDRMANAIDRRMNLEEKLLPVINDDLAKMERIEKAINSLDDPMEQDVLTYRFIDGYYDEEGNYIYDLMPWDEVAMRIYKGNDEKHLQAVYRLRKRALDSIREVELEE